MPMAKRTTQNQAIQERFIPELLTTKQAAALCSAGERTFWRWSRSGIAPRPLRVGGSVKYRRRDIQAWIDEGCPRCAL